jgi:hypothetical protein
LRINMSQSAAPTIFNFDPVTRIFSGQSLADESPLEPDVWLMPASSTLIEPPVAAPDHVAVFGESLAWQLVPDRRGTWYNSDGYAVEISSATASVAGLMRTAQPSADHVIEADQWVLSAAKVAARFAAYKAVQFKAIREQREIMLNRLVAIAFVAQGTGDSATVAACLTARQALLDLTKHPSLASATTEAALKTAYKSVYGAIVAATPAAIRSIYADLGA